MQASRVLGPILVTAGFLAGALSSNPAPKVAVTPFELWDLTQMTGGEAEAARTASLQGSLSERLAHGVTRYQASELDPSLTEAASRGGFGYLFEHDDVAAELGRSVDADVIAVGRIQKPSFLFAYLMVHLVDTRSGERIGAFSVEVKGQQGPATERGIERLGRQIEAKLAEHFEG